MLSCAHDTKGVNASAGAVERDQARLLAALLLQPDREASIADLAREIGDDPGNLHSDVTRLLAAGLLADRRVGRTRLLRATADDNPRARRQDERPIMVYTGDWRDQADVEQVVAALREIGITRRRSTTATQTPSRAARAAEPRSMSARPGRPGSNPGTDPRHPDGYRTSPWRPGSGRTRSRRDNSAASTGPARGHHDAPRDCRHGLRRPGAALGVRRVGAAVRRCLGSRGRPGTDPTAQPAHGSRFRVST